MDRTYRVKYPKRIGINTLNRVRSYRTRGKDNQDPLEKSRSFFILEGITGIGQFALVTGAFLAGFVSFLGGGETLNGSLGVVPAAVGLVQIFSSLLLKGGKSRKQQVIKVVILVRILLSILYFVPFVVMNVGASKEIVLGSFISCFIIAFIANGLAAPMVSGWLIDVTPLAIRGNYLAKREKISLSVIAITTIILGRILDFNKSSGNEFTGFLIVGIVLCIMGMLNVYSLLRMEDTNSETIDYNQSFMTRIMTPLKDHVFRIIIGFYILWNSALFIGGPYIAVYQVEKLHLTYTYMMTMAVIGSIIRVVFSSFWGNHADKKSWFSSASWSLVILGIVHMSWGIVVASNAWILVPVLSLLNGIAWAGVAISLFNIQFLFAKKEIRTMSISVNAAIGGTFSIVAVKVGGWIVELGDQAITVGSMDMSGFQLSFILSGFLLLLCAGFVILVLNSLTDNIQE